MDPTPDGEAQEHNARVREQFRLQAPTWTAAGFAASNLDWIVEQLAPRAGEQALDVACGAGHLGRALAPHLAHVEALDLTPEMLAHGDRLAREGGVTNVGFALGDATALPWLDAQFDLVVCRLTRPAGRLGITDLVLRPGDDGTGEVDPAVVELNTRLERLRDPSHGRTLGVAEIHRMLREAGVAPTATTTRDNPLDVEDWMERSRTPDADREEIRRRLDDELAGGPVTGLRPGRDGDARTLTHLWATVLGTPESR